MSIEQNLYEEKFEKIFPLKPVLNAIACINRTFAVNPIWYILSGLVLRLARLALINNLSNLRMTILEKISSRLQDMTSHLPFLVDQCEDMPWWSKRVAVSQEIWDRLLQGAETLCSPSAICVALSRSVH